MYNQHGSGNIAAQVQIVPDTLLDETKMLNFHDRTESKITVGCEQGHASRHSKQLSSIQQVIQLCKHQEYFQVVK